MVVHTYFVEEYVCNSLSITNVVRHYEIPDEVEHRRDNYFSLEKAGAVYLHTADKYHRPRWPTITGAKRHRSIYRSL